MSTFDPYKVLGLNRGASVEEAKKAQRNLAKKYHPDRHSDPVAKELAEDKMAEINRAYDMIESGEADRYYRKSEYNPYNPFGGNDTRGSSNQGGYRNPFDDPENNPWQRQSTQNRTYRQEGQGCCSGDVCDTLCCLCMADGCCECMGVDLIPCC